MNEHQISLANKTGNAKKVTDFKTQSVKLPELEMTLKSHNFSLISWKIDPDNHDNGYNRRRKADNFESASGVVIDIDDGLTIAEARQRLETGNLNHVLITSKSHQKAKGDKGVQDRYHILVFFNKVTISAEKYQGAFGKLRSIFPEMDTSVKDLARFIFASPDDAEYFEFFEGEFFDIDSIADDDYLTTFTQPDNERKIWEFDLDLEVKLSDGRKVKVSDIDGKHPICCPRDEHKDENPSAFVQYLEDRDKFMINCSACGWTGWSKTTRFQSTINKGMEDFYFCGKDVLEMGLSDDAFFATKLKQEAFNIIVDARTKEQQEAAFEHLVENRRLKNFSQVEYITDPSADKSGYSVNHEKGSVEVKIPPRPVETKDNEFIEKYLQQTFGEQKDFIKKFMAMYSYINFLRLPTLVLHGPRGSSKSTFANMLADIYPSMYMDWAGSIGNFTPEAEKKLLIIEENISSEKAMYKSLKKLTGQPYLLVNKKYQPEYQVKNNINVILISNEAIPLYVEKSELPTDEANNQFFVWEFPSLKSTPDAHFPEKLRQRIGHYVRTELKTVYDNIHKKYTRYGIPVPITVYERKLFENNTTNVEAQADLVLEKVENAYQSRLSDGRLLKPNFDEFESPKEPTFAELKIYQDKKLAYCLIDKFTDRGIHANAIVKDLKKRGIIMDEAFTSKVKGKKYRVYHIIKR